MNYILINIFLIILYVYYLHKIKHGFHILQLESYKNERYKRWINENKNLIIKRRELLLIVPSILIYINKTLAIIVGIIIALLLYISRDIYIEKKPLIITKRVKRMYVTSSIIFIILAILANIFEKLVLKSQILNNILLSIALIAENALVIFSIYVVILINKINEPIENNINKSFYNEVN